MRTQVYAALIATVAAATETTAEKDCFKATGADIVKECTWAVCKTSDYLTKQKNCKDTFPLATGKKASLYGNCVYGPKVPGTDTSPTLDECQTEAWDFTCSHATKYPFQKTKVGEKDDSGWCETVFPLAASKTPPASQAIAKCIYGAVPTGSALTTCQTDAWDICKTDKFPLAKATVLGEKYNGNCGTTLFPLALTADDGDCLYGVTSDKGKCKWTADLCDNQEHMTKFSNCQEEFPLAKTTFKNGACYYGETADNYKQCNNTLCKSAGELATQGCKFHKACLEDDPSKPGCFEPTAENNCLFGNSGCTTEICNGHTVTAAETAPNPSKAASYTKLSQWDGYLWSLRCNADAMKQLKLAEDKHTKKTTSTGTGGSGDSSTHDGLPKTTSTCETGKDCDTSASKDLAPGWIALIVIAVTAPLGALGYWYMKKQDALKADGDYNRI